MYIFVSMQHKKFLAQRGGIQSSPKERSGNFWHARLSIQLPVFSDLMSKLTTSKYSYTSVSDLEMRFGEVANTSYTQKIYYIYKFLLDRYLVTASIYFQQTSRGNFQSSFLHTGV